MKLMRKSWLIVLVLSLSFSGGPLVALAKAESINGNHWSQWSYQDKLIYIRGLCNWADFVTEAQVQNKKTYEFCISKVFIDELKTKTLGQIVAEVDAFYQKNPSKSSKPVIEAILRSSTNVCPR